MENETPPLLQRLRFIRQAMARDIEHLVQSKELISEPMWLQLTKEKQEDINAIDYAIDQLFTKESKEMAHQAERERLMIYVGVNGAQSMTQGYIDACTGIVRALEANVTYMPEPTGKERLMIHEWHAWAVKVIKETFAR